MQHDDSELMGDLEAISRPAAARDEPASKQTAGKKNLLGRIRTDDIKMTANDYSLTLYP